MGWLTKLGMRLRALRRGDEVYREIAEEWQFHIDLRTEENIRRGMMPEEARQSAERHFGNSAYLKDVSWDARGGGLVEALWQDLRYGLRMLRKSPGFTAVVILTLALGIGANAAIFSVVNALVLRPVPVYAPSEIVSLAHEQAGLSSNGFSYPDFDDIRNQTTSVFRDLTGGQPFVMDGLSMKGQNQSIWMDFVTMNFFQVMGIRPALGTFFQPANGKIEGSDPVLVVSYSFWQTHLGADPNVVGRSASINGHPVTIIGVAPKGFGGIFPILDTQGYSPIGLAAVTADSPEDFLTDRKAENLILVGRLKSGASIGQAQSALAVVARRLSQQYPDIRKWHSLQAFPIGPAGPVSSASDLTGIASMAAFFLVLVGLVLVLACLNVANLVLVRAAAREREMAVRAALGAGRGRLARQLLTESLLLALLGCIGGIFLGIGASRGVNAINFKSAIPLVFNVSFDWRVFAYTFGAALLTEILVGLTPAIRTARGNLTGLLHENPRTGTARRQRTRSILVVAELSGSLMLLIVAGLFVRSLRSAERSDLGFDPDHVVNLTVAPMQAGYNQAQAMSFLKQLLQEARALPGVESASLAATIPMGYYNHADELTIQGYQTPPGQRRPAAGYNAVSPDYFRTMRIPRIQGRDFRDSDDDSSPYVAIVNEEMANTYWPNQNPLGKHFVVGTDTTHPIQIVGVVKNSHTHHITGSFYPYFYRPFGQSYHNPSSIQLRTELPSATAFHQTLDLIHSLAPAMPVFDVRTMRQALDTLNGLLLYQIGAVLTASLGILGLLLGLVGVYGVVSYAASQRTHEIGIRMALGAAPSQVLRMILGQGLVVVSAGVVLGALLAGGIGRLARDFLSGVSPTDPFTYVSASAVLAVVALLACFVPARRAMRVDPMVALRHE